MKDLIVTDFDHILINEDEEIPASTIILFDELRRENKKVIILTDSQLNRILYYNYSFPFIDYIISSSGAYIYDAVKEKVIYKKNILYSNVNKIVKLFYDKSKIYLLDDTNCNLVNGYVEDEDIVIIDNYEDYLINNKNNIYKIDLVLNKGVSVQDCINKLNELNLKINLIVTDDEDESIISIVHEDVNKLNSLDKLISKCKRSLEDVIYIGRDKDVLENIGIAVTTNEEVPYLKKISTAVTDDCNHKGVEKFLRKYYEKEN